ncbi:MAG: hypothetical protein AAF460_04030 [Pseudomonadota bacterium]
MLKPWLATLRVTAPLRWLLTTAVVAILVLVLAQSRWLDDTSTGYIDGALQRALVAFAVARALNGVVSVAQGTEFALEPAGIGVNFAPGQVLDPINDMVERFAWVMLAASSSLGMQKALLSMSAWWLTTALLAGTLVAAIAGVAFGWWQKPRFAFWLKRLLLVVLVLRFAVPVSVLMGELAYQQFLAPQYATAQADLEATRDRIGSLNDALQTADNDAGLLSQLGNAARTIGNWQESLAAYEQAATDAAQSTLDLIVVFLLQSVVLPLLFLYGLFSLGRVLLRA